MSRRIAFFDFDGTITNKDTLLEMFKFRHGIFKYYLGFFLHLPVLLAYRCKIVSNQHAKEVMLNFFFSSMTTEEFQQCCTTFAETRLPSFIRPKALQEIKKLQDTGAEVVIVSASAQDWINDWCKSMGLSLIATRLQVANGKITGKIDGLNCHGKEKVRRIKASYDLSASDEIYCYGDTKGDKPMLALARISFYKPFR